MSTDTNPDLIMCGTCGDEFTQHDRGTCGNCMAGETAALHVEIERLTAERDALRAELTALRVQETAASGGPTIVVDLTDEQRAYVRSLLSDMPEGGSCFAQVYCDAMRVRTFDVATTRRVASAIGITTGAEGLHTSAYDAQEAAMTADILN